METTPRDLHLTRHCCSAWRKPFTTMVAILVLSCVASANDAPCDWERQLVSGNGVDLFGSSDNFAGGVWVAGKSRTTTSPFLDLNFVARWTAFGWETMVVPQPASMGDDQKLSAIASLNADDAVAVGSAFLPATPTVVSSPQSLRWDGVSWSLLVSPTFVGGGFFTDTTVAGNTFWAVGSKNEVTPNGPLLEPFAARLDGNDWITVDVPLFGIVGNQTLASYRMLAVGGSSTNDVWMGGRLFVSGEPIHDAVLSHWDGTQWTWFDVRPLLSTPGASSTIESIAALATDDVWAVGQEYDTTIGRERALILHWDGVAWSRAVAPVESNRYVWLRDVVARSATDIYAVGTASAPGQWPDGYVLRYDGTTWTSLGDVETADGSQFFTAATADDGTLWLAGLTNEFPIQGFAQRGLVCASPLFIRADATGDGSVDLSDALATLGLLFAGGSVPCLEATDANGDDIVSLADVIYVLGYLFSASSGATIPAPFPACGLAPTPSVLDCVDFPACLP